MSEYIYIYIYTPRYFLCIQTHIANIKMSALCFHVHLSQTVTELFVKRWVYHAVCPVAWQLTSHGTYDTIAPEGIRSCLTRR